MTPSNPLFAIVILIITFLTGYLINLKYKLATPTSNRYEGIDGLRGFLAISVFIHHSNIWYKYLHTGGWIAPDSNLYNQLGSTAVSFFFMISSFLFVKILMDYKGENYNWKNFFIKRFFRLAPLHFFATAAIITVVFIQSNWIVISNHLPLVQDMLKWFGFGLVGLGNVNYVDASKINAGVLWSIKYEWLLYFALPLVSLIILKSKPKILVLVISLALVVFALRASSYGPRNILSFVGGAIAPIILKYNKKKINFNNIWFTLTLICSSILIFQFHSSDNYLCKFFITLSFTLIALGNNLFGLLKISTLKLLGEISYSTYLLHGIIIFATIHYGYGLEETKLLSPMEFCLLIFTCAPLVILISFITFKYIEKPFIALAKRITKPSIQKTNI